MANTYEQELTEEYRRISSIATATKLLIGLAATKAYLAINDLSEPHVKKFEVVNKLRLHARHGKYNPPIRDIGFALDKPVADNDSIFHHGYQVLSINARSFKRGLRGKPEKGPFSHKKIIDVQLKYGPDHDPYHDSMRISTTGKAFLVNHSSETYIAEQEADKLSRDKYPNIESLRQEYSDKINGCIGLTYAIGSILSQDFDIDILEYPTAFKEITDTWRAVNPNHVISVPKGGLIEGLLANPTIYL